MFSSNLLGFFSSRTCTYKIECCANISFIKAYIQCLHFQKQPCHCVQLSQVGCSSMEGAWEHWHDQCWCLMKDGPQVILYPDLTLCSCLWAKGTPGYSGPWTNLPGALSCLFPTLQQLYPCSAYLPCLLPSLLLKDSRYPSSPFLSLPTLSIRPSLLS